MGRCSDMRWSPSQANLTRYMPENLKERAVEILEEVDQAYQTCESRRREARGTAREASMVAQNSHPSRVAQMKTTIGTRLRTIDGDVIADTLEADTLLEKLEGLLVLIDPTMQLRADGGTAAENFQNPAGTSAERQEAFDRMIAEHDAARTSYSALLEEWEALLQQYVR